MTVNKNDQAAISNQHTSNSLYSGISFEKGMATVERNPEGQLVVDAFKLHKSLKVTTRFNDWMSRRIQEFGFVEGVDFYSNLSKSTGGRRRTSYELNLDTAKEFALVEKTDQGRKIRRYFIEVEKLFREMLERLHTPVNGVMPIHCDGKLGFPRKEFLISVGRSYKNGYRLNKQFPNESFLIGYTACISVNLATHLTNERDLRLNASKMKLNQTALSL